MEIRMSKNPLANVMVRAGASTHKNLFKVLGALGKEDAGIYAVLRDGDIFRLYVKEDKSDRIINIMSRVMGGDSEFYVKRKVGMITIKSENGDSKTIPINTIMSQLRGNVNVLDMVSNGGSFELFVDLKGRDAAFNSLVGRITKGYNVRKV